MIYDEIECTYMVYPNVTHTRGDVAYDANGDVVNIDKKLVLTKVAEMQAKQEAATQAQADARQSALNKLMALGLTEEEALALGVK